MDKPYGWVCGTIGYQDLEVDGAFEKSSPWHHNLVEDVGNLVRGPAQSVLGNHRSSFQVSRWGNM
jgi:hypothetical protein